MIRWVRAETREGEVVDETIAQILREDGPPVDTANVLQVTELAEAAYSRWCEAGEIEEEDEVPELFFERAAAQASAITAAFNLNE